MSWTVTILKDTIDPITLQNSTDPVIINNDGSVIEGCGNLNIEPTDTIFCPFELIFNKDSLSIEDDTVSTPVYKIDSYHATLTTPSLNSNTTYNNPGDWDNSNSDPKKVYNEDPQDDLTPMEGRMQICSGQLLETKDFQTKAEVYTIVTTGKGSITHKDNLSIGNNNTGAEYNPGGIGGSSAIDSSIKYWATSWQLGNLIPPLTAVCSGELWGPGYDDLPMQLTLNGGCILGRVDKCRWISSVCVTNAGVDTTAYATPGYCPPEYSGELLEAAKFTQTNVELWYGWDEVNYSGQQLWNLKWDLTNWYAFTGGHPCNGAPFFDMPMFYGTKTQSLESPLGVYTMPSWDGDNRTITVT